MLMLPTNTANFFNGGSMNTNKIKNFILIFVTALSILSFIHLYSAEKRIVELDTHIRDLQAQVDMANSARSKALAELHIAKQENEKFAAQGFYRGVYAMCRVFAFKSEVPKPTAIETCQQITIGAAKHNAHEESLEGFDVVPPAEPDKQNG